MDPVEALPVKILIVDDDDVYRDILRDAIEDEGTDLSLASTGEEALELIRAEPFDILITDLNMPGMDGLTLLRQARRHLPNVLTIIITGYGSLESAVEAIRQGAYDYIQKPFRIDEVAVATRNAIDKVRSMRERAILLAELEKAYHRLRELESKRTTGTEDHEPGPGTSGETPGYERFLVMGRQPLPVELLEGGLSKMGHVLSELERLKDLRREKVIDEAEFERLKRLVLRQVTAAER
ncbi:MAG: response regulator [Desulfacinum sp.]|jgi:DNA-binding response OmpR family regulator|nr:response regulator [Desulfacinum sp.]MBZ4658862.1 response regulator receiver protein [Desulfacinum sp.]